VGNCIVHPRIRPELREIWEHIAKDNPAAADRVVDAAEQTFRMLADHPGMGRPRSFSRKTYRNLRSRAVVGFDNYLVLYREITDGVEILHVCHGARNLEALLRKDPRP
jgi:toxin ParE1/3/4